MKILERQKETIYKLADNIGLKNNRYFERFAYLESKLEKIPVGIIEKLADYYDTDLGTIYKELTEYRDSRLILLQGGEE